MIMGGEGSIKGDISFPLFFYLWIHFQFFLEKWHFFLVLQLCCGNLGPYCMLCEHLINQATYDW